MTGRTFWLSFSKSRPDFTRPRFLSRLLARASVASSRCQRRCLTRVATLWRAVHGLTQPLPKPVRSRRQPSVPFVVFHLLTKRCPFLMNKRIKYTKWRRHESSINCLSAGSGFLLLSQLKLLKSSFIKRAPIGPILKNRGEASLVATAKLIWQMGFNPPVCEFTFSQ